MRVPVLVDLPAQEPLIESATAAAEGRPPRIPVEEATVPSSVELDTTFPAVPVGTGDQNQFSLEPMGPAVSEHFVVRGFLELEEDEPIPFELDGRPVNADPPIAPFLTCGGSPPLGTAADVSRNLNGSVLAQRGLDGSGVAVAIVDTGINLAHLRTALGGVPPIDPANSWMAPGRSTAAFAHPVGHGTMCAYDALIMAPKATLIDFPVLRGSAPGGALTGSTLSVAVQAYAQLIAFWSVAFAPGGAPRYRSLVVSNSWGIYHPSWDFNAGHPGRYVDNPNHPFQVLVSVLTRGGADVVFAAGNCGAECASTKCQNRTTGTIMGANASSDVLTLAGCDVNDDRVGYSSQGPSISGMFQEKPDLSSYTHFSGSAAMGTGSPDSGTSAACPVAAGCVAAIRSKVSTQTLPPANLRQQLLAMARKVNGATTWNGDYGHGIIDPDATAQSLNV
ncbi:S8 family serine peptidase [Rhodococcus daqingensis]|uniref:S8 family serine peptidase n=1 Tax=Rhodococcus daqingensis TaxID=2479363 RepID=A0ABW2RS30_9NOCA